ncbi:hypothetical protein ACLOJK_014852 [Asimina triloba]
MGLLMKMMIMCGHCRDGDAVAVVGRNMPEENGKGSDPPIGPHRAVLSVAAMAAALDGDGGAPYLVLQGCTVIDLLPMTHLTKESFGLYIDQCKKIIDLMGFYPDTPKLSGMGLDIPIPLSHKLPGYRKPNDTTDLEYEKEEFEVDASIFYTSVSSHSGEDEEIVDDRTSFLFREEEPSLRCCEEDPSIILPGHFFRVCPLFLHF